MTFYPSSKRTTIVLGVSERVGAISNHGITARARAAGHPPTQSATCRVHQRHELPRGRGMSNEFDERPSYSLGNLDKLALEMLHQMLSLLDFRALVNFTETCTRGLTVVRSMPASRDLIKCEAEALRALGWSGSIVHHSVPLRSYMPPCNPRHGRRAVGSVLSCSSQPVSDAAANASSTLRLCGYSRLKWRGLRSEPRTQI